MGEQRRPTAAELLLSLAATGLMMWSLLPPQDRAQVRLRMVWVARRLLGGLAARQGRAGLAEEAAGRDPGPFYSSAYRLSLLRDRAARVLDGMMS